MKKDIKVKVTFTEGYAERFTEACVRVAKRRFENDEKLLQEKDKSNQES